MNLLKRLNQNKKRIITGMVLSAISIFCVIAGGIPIMLLVSVLVCFGAKEYIKILKFKGFYPSASILFLTIVLYIILAGFKWYDIIPVILALSTMAAFLAVLFKGKQPYIANVSTTVLGTIYCGWLPTHFILIRQLNCDGLGLFRFTSNEGLGFLLLMLFTVIATDVGGFYFGSRFGKNLLAPVVSPKKTIEGMVYGSIFAVVVAFIVGLVIKLSWYHSIIAGFLITMASQFGDLSESLIKRDAGVKDSGSTLPGHGGFLDRTDGYIFAAPVAFYYFKFFVLSNNFCYEFMHIIQKGFNLVGM